MKDKNLLIIDMDEWKESQVNDKDHIFNRIIDNFQK